MRFPEFTAEASFDWVIISNQKNNVEVSEINTLSVIPKFNGLPPSGGTIPDLGPIPGLPKPGLDLKREFLSRITTCNGKVTNVMSDPNNCGNCGVRCKGILCFEDRSCSGEMCTDGKCQDPCRGKAMCIQSYQNGVIDAACKDLELDIENCGICGRDCSVMYPSSTCEMGDCKCPAYAPTECGPVNLGGGGCVNLNTDPNNCGRCSTKCASEEYCDHGTCKIKNCPPGQTPICTGQCESVKGSSCCGPAQGALSGTTVYKCVKSKTVCVYEYNYSDGTAGNLMNCYKQP
jgi:Stigma-specific protein, Stig1